MYEVDKLYTNHFLTFSYQFLDPKLNRPKVYPLPDKIIVAFRPTKDTECRPKYVRHSSFTKLLLSQNHN